MKKLGILSALACAVLIAQAEEVKILESVGIEEEESYVSRDDIELSSPTNLYKTEKTARMGTEVITQEEIAAHKAKDIFDLLNKATGMDLTYHGRRSPFTLNMRGSSNITYIIDGAILPPSNSRILYKIPMIAIEEIQIVRSATSLAIAPSINVGASNSSSGVNVGYVIIRTKQPKKTEGILSGFYEQAVSQPAANGQSLYAGTRFGDTTALNGYLGAMVSRFDRASKETWFDGSEGASGMVNGGVKYGGLSLNFMGYKDSGRFELQRGVKEDGTLDNSKWYYDPLKTTVLSFDGSMAWSENQVTLFSLAQTKYEQNEHNENFANTTASTREYEEKTTTYSLRHNARFGDTKLQLGAQSVLSEGVGADLYNPFIDYDTSVLGASASVEQTLFDGDLVVDAGYRWDQKTINKSTAAKTQALLKPDANNNVDLAPASIITLGALYSFDDVHAMSGRYFYGDQGISGDFDLVTEDASPLHSEKQNRFDISLESKFAAYFNSLITYFDTDVTNEKRASSKSYIVDGEEYYYYTEVDSRTKGLELTLHGNIATNTRYKLSWTRVLSKETQEYANVSDEAGVTLPKNTFTALLSHAWEEYRFNISAKNASAYTSSQSPMGLSDADLGDYTRIDANIARDFLFANQTLSAKIYGRNLTNDQYATKYTTGYYYDRGRTLGVELEVAF